MSPYFFVSFVVLSHLFLSSPSLISSAFSFPIPSLEAVQINYCLNDWYAIHLTGLVGHPGRSLGTVNIHGTSLAVCGRALHLKVIVAQLVKKFPAFYWTWRLSTRTCHVTPTWANLHSRDAYVISMHVFKPEALCNIHDVLVLLTYLGFWDHLLSAVRYSLPSIFRTWRLHHPYALQPEEAPDREVVIQRYNLLHRGLVHPSSECSFAIICICMMNTLPCLRHSWVRDPADVTT
jgi:hypothetical protein